MRKILAHCRAKRNTINLLTAVLISKWIKCAESCLESRSNVGSLICRLTDLTKLWCSGYSVDCKAGIFFTTTVFVGEKILWRHINYGKSKCVIFSSKLGRIDFSPLNKEKKHILGRVGWNLPGISQDGRNKLSFDRTVETSIEKPLFGKIIPNAIYRQNDKFRS